MNKQDACSTKSEFSCGTGILPVADNVSRSGFNRRMMLNDANGEVRT